MECILTAKSGIDVVLTTADFWSYLLASVALGCNFKCDGICSFPLEVVYQLSVLIGI